MGVQYLTLSEAYFPSIACNKNDQQQNHIRILHVHMRNVSHELKFKQFQSRYSIIKVKRPLKS